MFNTLSNLILKMELEEALILWFLYRRWRRRRSENRRHVNLPNDTDNWQRYKTDGGVLKIKKKTVPRKSRGGHISSSESELRTREKQNLNSKRKLEDDTEQPTSSKSARQTVSPEYFPGPVVIKQENDTEIEQIYLPEYQPYPGSSRFSSVGTMTNIETSTKSTMCVPEDFNTDEFSNPHPTSCFDSSTENTDFTLVSSIKIEPEDMDGITVKNETS